MNSNNHPSRAWRTHMRAACAIWLQHWAWQAALGARLVSGPELRGIMRDSYFDGYEAGRASLQPKPATTPRKANHAPTHRPS